LGWVSFGQTHAEEAFLCFARMAAEE
jgi:hypothetical protein